MLSADTSVSPQHIRYTSPETKELSWPAGVHLISAGVVVAAGADVAVAARGSGLVLGIKFKRHRYDDRSAAIIIICRCQRCQSRPTTSLRMQDASIAVTAPSPSISAFMGSSNVTRPVTQRRIWEASIASMLMELFISPLT